MNDQFKANQQLLGSLTGKKIELPPKIEPLPHITFLHAHDNSVVYKYKKRLVNSAYNPVKEAAHKLKTAYTGKENRFLFLGADMLYTAEKLTATLEPAKCRTGSYRFFFVFHNLTIFYALLKYRSLVFLKPVLPYCFFIIKEHSALKSSDVAPAHARGTAYIVNQTLYQDDQPYYESIKAQYLHYLSEHYSAGLTKFYFEKRWLRNAMQNLAMLPQSFDLKQLYSTFSGRNCLLVMAGP
ncbi:MAG TPA: hypothetical protein VKS21_05910, partial [Spirochaetota bacterium]|nr:hypothetical protein [Spirochaetota bacterium]